MYRIHSDALAFFSAESNCTSCYNAMMDDIKLVNELLKTKYLTIVF